MYAIHPCIRRHHPPPPPKFPVPGWDEDCKGRVWVRILRPLHCCNKTYYFDGIIDSPTRTDKPHVSLLNFHFRSNIVQLRLYFEDLTIQKVQQMPAYTGAALFGKIYKHNSITCYNFLCGDSISG